MIFEQNAGFFYSIKKMIWKYMGACPLRVHLFEDVGEWLHICNIVLKVRSAEIGPRSLDMC